MNYLIFLGHPAHYHLFKNIIKELTKKGNNIKVLIRKKDILEDLCQNDNFDYVNVLPETRGSSLLSIGHSYLRKYSRISAIIREFKPSLLLGSEPTLTHLGRLFNIPSFVFSEDDAAIIPQFAKIAYPFVDKILSPNSCNAGKWEYKKIGYDGYHKLAYLHPAVFQPQLDEIAELEVGTSDYFILRYAELNSYHDANKSGITNAIATEMINILKPHGKIFITSERSLPDDLKQYKLNINPLKIHHVLSYAKLYIGDSQSMAVESALLGTPGIRFNDFSGEIGVLNELEYTYGLTHSFKTTKPIEMFEKLESMLKNKNLRMDYIAKRKLMLKDKINVLSFFIWFIENYPTSASILNETPDYQYNFR